MNNTDSSNMRGRRWIALVAVLFFVFMAACSRSQHWLLHDISGLSPALKFRLTDDTGRTVEASNYRGKVVLLYFGYTHCTDVCPDTLAKLAGAIDNLGSEGADVRVLFVTVDPARDTIPVLHRYVREFGPEFVGLRGSNDALLALAKRYRVVYTRAKANAHGNYDVSHSSGVFIFDGSGKARLLATNADTAADISHDLRLLLRTG